MRKSRVAVMVVLALLLALPVSAALVNRYSFIPSSDPEDPNAIDSVGGMDGVPMGTAAQTDGQLVLDSGGWVALPANVLSDYTSASVEVWFTMDATSGWARLFDFGDTSGNDGGYCWFLTPTGPGNLRLAISTGGFPSWSTGEEVVNGPAMTAATDYHLVAVYDQAGGAGGNAAMRLFLNGTEVAANETVTMLLSDVHRAYALIGKAVYPNDPLFDGFIDEFRIYNTPLNLVAVTLNAQLGPDNYSECVLASMSPENDAINIAPSAPLNWNPLAAVTVDHYEVFVTNDPNLVDPNSAPVPALTPVYSGADTSTIASGLGNLKTYAWRVDTIAADTTRYVGPRYMFTTAPAGPVFTTSPKFSAIFPAEAAVLSAVCQSTSPLTPVQWFKVGTPDVEITEADPDVTIAESTEGEFTTCTLTIANVEEADAGEYYAKATNAGGSGTSANGTIIIKELLAYYPFEGNADDASGNGMNGTGTTLGVAPYNVLPTYTTGKVGQAVDLSNNYLNYIDLPDGFADFRPGLTINLWAYPTAAGNWANFIQFSNGAPVDNIFFCRNSTSETLWFRTANGTTENTGIGGNVAIALNQWQMFTVTLDASGVARLYKNGVRYFYYNNNGTINTPQVTMPILNNVTRVNNYIGKSAWGDAYFTGQLDEIRVYNYALTDDEIAQQYFVDAGVGACQNKPTYDYNGDCKVTVADFAMFATQWLNCGLYPADECN